MAYQPKSYRKFVATAATATLVATAVTPAFAADFKDVNADYKDAVNYLVENKIAEGLTETKFGPEKTIKRGDAAVMIAKALKLDTANAPASPFKDLNSRVKNAVNALYAAGIVGGKTKTTFEPDTSINRAEMAKILTNAYKLEAGDTKNDFTDVHKGWDKYVDALLANDITKGKTETTFAPYQEVTRGEFALFMYRAKDFLYEIPAASAVKVADDKTLEVTLKEAKEGLKAENFKVLVDGDKVAPTEVKAGDKGATYKLTIPSLDNKKGKVSVNGAEASYDFTAAKVESVSANNSTTLTITGSNLDQLKVEDITVADNTVKSITASADKKSTVVVLNSPLTPDEKVSVTVLGKTYDVTYKVDASSAAVVEATYDDDIANQFVAITVDGKKVTAQELINAGYTVEFEAFTTKAATTSANIFAGATATNTSATGELTAPITLTTNADDYYVKVTLTKGSDVITSPLQKITIKNLDIAAGSITGARLLNNGATGATTDDFYQASSTLVTGETAAFDKLDVKSGSDTEEITSGYTVKSSNPAVVSVDNTGVLTAQGPGTATVTVTYGGATYTKTITVKNETREATKVSAEKTSVTVTEGGSTTVKVKLLDQYGDPMAITAITGGGAGNVEVVGTNTTKATASLADSTAPKGEAVLTITGGSDGAGSSVFTFRDAAGVKIGTTAITANVTTNADLSQYSLAVDSDISADDVTAVATATSATVVEDQISTDATLDLQSDKYLKLNIKGLNSAGVEVVSAPASASYNVTVAPSRDGVLAATPFFKDNGFLVIEAGSKTGTATITVTNAADSKIVKTFKVTVTDVGYNVTGATLKNVANPTYSQTLNYEDFLSYTEAANDPVISGLTLTKNVAQPIRLDEDGSETNTAGDTSAIGSLYIDKDADGIFNNDDSLVGSVTITTTGTIAANVGNEPIADVTAGVAVASGDDGTVLFKVLDSKGNVVATKAVTVDF